MKKHKMMFRKVFLTLSVITFLSVMYGGCKQPSKKDGSKEAKVTITVDGDGNVATGKNVSFEVDKGATWKVVKTKPEIANVTFKDGFELSEWKLNSATGEVLADTYAFNANAKVFAVSKQEPTPKVTITVDGDGNVATGKNVSFEVDKGTTWKVVKTKPQITGITFKDDFELSEWKLNSATGEALTDTYVFDANATVFAVSKQETPKVTITVDGDDNIVDGKNVTFKVDQGTKWEVVKTKSQIADITFKGGFELSEWRLNNNTGEVLTDAYVFNANATVFAVSKIQQVTIRVDGDGNVTGGKNVTFEVKKGTKWEVIKERSEIKDITFRDGFELLEWKLKNAIGITLVDTYTFDANATVFAVSKRKPIPKITITVDGDDNVATGKDVTFEVDKGTKWEVVKTKPQITGITFNDGFELSEWKLNNGTGETLTDTHVFDANATVFAVSKNETTPKVTITVDGDDNVADGKGVTFKVDTNATWAVVKEKPQITGITFNDGFELSEWKLNNAGGNALTDEHAFSVDATVFAISKPTPKVTITVNGDEHVATGKNVTFEVERGTKWEVVKTKPEITGITFSGEYSLDVWRLNNADGEKLEDSYVFNDSQTVFAVSALYVKVAYANLDSYLKDTASGSKLNYIEVTGVSAIDLMAPETPIEPNECSPLGNILNLSPSKMVALKLPEEVVDLINMSFSFSKCNTLKSLYAFPKSVTNLERCFYLCKNLNDIPDIPEGVVNMKGCFIGCEAIETAPAIPKSVNNMDGCFSSCINLKKAPVIDEQASNLNMDGCFFKCENLVEVPGIPAGVITMVNCFWGCKKLQNAPAIPSDVRQMKFCFRDCVALTEVGDIPQGVVDIFGCFWGCENLVTVPSAIPEGVINMGACFMNCSKLVTAPSIPESVTNLLMTFKNCGSLKTAVLNGAYQEQFKQTFTGCSNIEDEGIKVKAEHLNTYQSKADIMGTTANKFAAQ